jgi:hypothetical protein
MTTVERAKKVARKVVEPQEAARKFADPENTSWPTSKTESLVEAAVEFTNAIVALGKGRSR